MTSIAISEAKILAWAARVTSGKGAALAAALWIMSRAAAIRMLMSASIHYSPWNFASGRPNCSRSPTYARVRR